MTMTSLVPLVVLIPLLGAAAALVLGRSRTAQRAIAVIALAAVLVIGGVLVVAADGGPLVMEVGGWDAPFGIVLVVDRLSALMVAVSAIVLLAVLMFSVGQGIADGDEETPVTIFFPTYLILAAGVFNSFIAGDLFNLYVGFEILLVASYVLMTLGGTTERIRAGTTYIVVSLVSSVLFLASIAMIYATVGTVNIAQIASRMAEAPVEVQTLLHVMLLTAFGIKAAVFPLSFWLPDSYPTAPAPVTAVFAGLLTKVGVYAIIRMFTLVFPADAYTGPIIAAIAALTMITGVLGAASHFDVRRILSFHIISQVGYMLVGVAVATPLALAGSILYVVHHIVVKANLFLIAGAMRAAGGSFDLKRLGGLQRSAPILAALFFVPAMSLAGMPPLSGFWAKFLVIKSSIDEGYLLLAAAALVVGLLTLYSMVKVWNEAFWKPPPESGAPEQRWLDDGPGRLAMLAPVAGLAAITLTIGFAAEPFVDFALRAANQLLDTNGYIDAVLGTPSAPPGPETMPSLP